MECLHTEANVAHLYCPECGDSLCAAAKIEQRHAFLLAYEVLEVLLDAFGIV